MAKYNYSRYKIRMAPDTKAIQGLMQGDIVRRQYADCERSVYTLMVALDVGEERVESPEGVRISPYFIGALLEGDEPRDGELLDFVRVSNLFDAERGGAIYLTASDSESPYMDVIDGVGRTAALCYPTAGNGAEGDADPTRYSCTGKYLTSSYAASGEGVSRIFRMTRNKTELVAAEKLGLRQNLQRKIGYPQRLIVSCKVRASKALSGVPLVVECTTGPNIDGQDAIDVSTQWQYKLSVISLEYPELFRTVRLDLSEHLQPGEWLEVAELNIVLLSDVATFANATTVRIGKVTGIVDPLFGVLDGYGAYFQNLYATKNVSIAGTLTAGDEQGFSSTFYVGRIHKNCMTNSLQPRFRTQVIPTSIKPPAGVGEISLLPAGRSTLECQDEMWALTHSGQQYCFSFWVYSSSAHTLTIEQGDTVIGTVAVTSDWSRHALSFRIRHISGEPLYIHLDGMQTAFFASPQLESGYRPTFYQPTDDVLTETEDYGAWFSRGGIGGTIQNPLLRLNDDGSISSRDGSFVINHDGTGHFAGGRFKWTKDTIELQDFTIKWEDIKGVPGPLQAYISSNQPFTQVYNKESNSCTPNWALSPNLVLTPSLYVGGNAGVDVITSVADAAAGKAGIVPGSVVWYKNGTAAVSGGSLSIATVSGKYALTCKNNAIGTYAPQMRFTFTAVYQTEGGTQLPVKAEVQFTLLVNASAAIRAVAYAPDGTVFKNGEITSLRVHCDMWRGGDIDDTKVTYSWGVRDEAVFAPTKLSKAAAKGDTVLTVYTVANMQPGHTLHVIYEPFTIVAVNELTNEVTLDKPQSGPKSVNCMITCPDYNALLGAGWFPLSAAAPRGTTGGWGTNEIALTPDAVLNYETFKCAIQDNDTSSDNATANKIVCDMLSFADQSDPIVVNILSPDGFTIKNSGQDTDATAVVMRGLQEIDAEGTLYTYRWRLWDAAGEVVIRTYSGKTITVAKGTVTDKGVLSVEVFD